MGAGKLRLSGLHAPDTDFLYGDVFEWLGRLARRGAQFDLVILDPPSFARGPRGTWRSERDYGGLMALASAVTAPGGQVLALLNHAGVTPGAFERMVLAGLDDANGGEGRRARLSDHLSSGEDYPGATHLKAHVWTLE